MSALDRIFRRRASSQQTIEAQVRNIIRRQSSAFNGVWYDPSDLSTLFQDSAGTTPVTAVEQSVGLILDKSGRGNHASQATTGYKPVLKQDANGCYYLKFDGSDDFLVTGNIDFSTTDKVAVAAGVRKLSDALLGMVCEFSAAFNANAGTFFLAAPVSSGAANMALAIKGTAESYATVTGVPAPLTCVLSGAGRISTDTLYVRQNGVTKTTTPSDAGAGNFGNYPLYIGSRAGSGFRYNGHLYGLCICGGLDDITKLRKIERLLAKKTGVVV